MRRFDRRYWEYKHLIRGSDTVSIAESAGVVALWARSLMLMRIELGDKNRDEFMSFE